MKHEYKNIISVYCIYLYNDFGKTNSEKYDKDYKNKVENRSIFAHIHYYYLFLYS